MAKMTWKDKRRAAIGAARHEMRKRNIPFSVESAELILDDLARVEPDKVAAQFWMEASDNQYKLFKRELSKWIENRNKNYG